LNSHGDNIEDLSPGPLYLGAGLSLIGIEILGLPVFDHDFRTFGSALTEELFDLAAGFVNDIRKSGNHLRQFEAVVLMERTDQRRLEVG
jgi:hypothetical protein